MNEAVADTPQAALQHYSQAMGPGAPVAAATDGLVNETWSIGSPPAFALQRVAPQFGDDVSQRIDAVTRRLRTAGMQSPELIRTDDGACSLPATEGRRWRLLTWIPGLIHHRMPDAAHARSAASLVARFHDALMATPEGRSLPISDFHDTGARLSHMADALDKPASKGLESEIRRLGDAIAEAWHDWRQPPEDPARVRPGHGDLKVSNIVFDAAGGKALALIDFDTLGRYALDAELGDTLRSWCNPAGEDTVDAVLDTHLFEASISGYISASTSVTQQERDSLVYGLGRISLELAARFLADAVEDRYFAWNPAVAPSRPAHNLLRAAGQLALARQVRARRRELEAIVKRY